MKQPVVTVVGGSGFVGRYVVKRLAEAGYVVRVLCRYPAGAKHLRVSGNVGQVVIDYADLTKPETLKGKLAGSFAVVNLVGVLAEHGRQSFTRVQAQGAEKLAQEAKSAGVKRFVHVSALGVDVAKSSKYARTKVVGEEAIRAVFEQAVILRPSVIFGAEDKFFNRFARMAHYAPVLPAVGGGKALLQPVYVDDVARAVLKAVSDEACGGKTYQLGGPQMYQLKELMQLAARFTGRSRMVLPVPFAVAKMVAQLAQFAPNPPITPDQVRLLKYDNVVSVDAPGLIDLGIRPTPLEAVVPDYLSYRNKVA